MTCAGQSVAGSDDSPHNHFRKPPHGIAQLGSSKGRFLPRPASWAAASLMLIVSYCILSLSRLGRISRLRKNTFRVRKGKSTSRLEAHHAIADPRVYILLPPISPFGKVQWTFSATC